MVPSICVVLLEAPPEESTLDEEAIVSSQGDWEPPWSPSSSRLSASPNYQITVCKSTPLKIINILIMSLTTFPNSCPGFWGKSVCSRIWAARLRSIVYTQPTSWVTSSSETSWVGNRLDVVPVTGIVGLKPRWPFAYNILPLQGSFPWYNTEPRNTQHALEPLDYFGPLRRTQDRTGLAGGMFWRDDGSECPFHGGSQA